MKTAPVLVLVLSLVCVSYCKDLIVGSSYNRLSVWKKKLMYRAIPLIKRVKEVFYSNTEQSLIKGITAKDLDHSDAEASITAGGVGFSYVNLKLKSARGSRLNYYIEVYI